MTKGGKMKEEVKKKKECRVLKWIKKERKRWKRYLREDLKEFREELKEGRFWFASNRLLEISRELAYLDALDDMEKELRGVK